MKPGLSSLACCLSASLLILPLHAESYDASIRAWRQTRVAALTSETGWLTVTGLRWLHDGSNTFGRDKSNQIVLADGPDRAGRVEVSGTTATLLMGSTRRVLAADSDDGFSVGHLRLFLLRRGDKFALRLKDPLSQARKNFHGIEYFPIRIDYRVNARWVPDPRQLPILNIIGQTEMNDSPGYAEFTLFGQKLTLRGILESPGDKELFFNFRDGTSGQETYPAGRFLYAPLPAGGLIVLDFNKAYNPPCAFTDYATCPLPTKENRTPVRIAAGEKRYGH
jgi:uncharacterized protein